MKTLVNNINRSFCSKYLEKVYIDQQMPGIYMYHRFVTLILFLFYIVQIVLSLLKKDYIMASFVIALALANIGQYLYFQRNPGPKCLTVINFYNIVIACMRLYQASHINQNYSHSYNSSFQTGACYFTLHIILLVNPYLTTNMLVMVCIFFINMACAWIIDGKIFLPGFSMLIWIGMLLWKIRLDNLVKRNLFIIKGEKSSWEHVLKVLIDKPYVIINYIKEEVKFDLVESNQAAKNIDINDSQSMKQVFRKMKIISDQKQNLEQFIYGLIKEVYTSGRAIFLDQQQQVVLDLKTKYMIKIFPLDQEFKTFLITFHNVAKSECELMQHQTIINQQIGFCNLVKQQYKFCLNLKQKLRQDQKAISVTVEKQMMDLINYMNIFKTDQKIILKKFSMQKVILKIKKFFPTQTIYVHGDNHLFCSDFSVYNQIFYNMFSLLNDKNKNQVFIVKIQKDMEHGDNNLVQVEILSKVINFKKLVFQNSLNLSLNNLAQVRKNGQLQLLMIQKQVKLVSPHEKLHLNQNNDQGINLQQLNQIL